MHCTRNWRSFSLSPAAGERGPTMSSIPRSYHYAAKTTHAVISHTLSGRHNFVGWVRSHGLSRQNAGAPGRAWYQPSSKSVFYQPVGQKEPARIENPRFGAISSPPIGKTAVRHQ